MFQWIPFHPLTEATSNSLTKQEKWNLEDLGKRTGSLGGGQNSAIHERMIKIKYVLCMKIAGVKVKRN